MTNKLFEITLSLDNRERLTYSNWMPGKPNHLQSNVDKCVAMKWYSDFSYHGNFKVGEWENKPYTQKHAWVCSHEQSPDMVKNK